jgi:hypothetical protein
MQQIGLDDPRWLTTLPQVVSPRDDEWLGGLLLRCDAANGWASRTTVAHLMRVVKKRMREAWRSDLANLIVWGKTGGYLQGLAQLLALTPQQVRATTYTDELACLFGLRKVNATLLTLSFSFQLCPACIAEERMLRRVLVLPYVVVCPEHQLALQHSCQCGAALRLFSKRTAPFCCAQCGADWGSLPRQSVRGEQLALSGQVLSWYRFFLTEGTPAVVRRARALLSQYPIHQDGRLREIASATGEVRKRSSYPRQVLPLPLGKLVASLVERELVLDDSMREYLVSAAGDAAFGRLSERM